ncbi:MAG TPA: hypothetical protein QGF58_05715 [Myxococcota bacterium]|nr:hypothetical protein [Myxococcota bacterium]
MLLLIAALGCNAGKTQCVDNGQCSDGQACVAEVCEDVDCLASADCEIGQYCNAGYACKDGCKGDDDCLAGQICDTAIRQCIEAGCESTELDCWVGQICDQVTGTCNDDDATCSETCHVYTDTNCGGSASCFMSNFGDECSQNSDCPSGSTCDGFVVSDDFCTRHQDCPAGAYCSAYQCLQDLCHADYCYNSCQSQADCPAGFSCLDSGIGKVCYGDCAYFKQNGYL